MNKISHYTGQAVQLCFRLLPLVQAGPHPQHGPFSVAENTFQYLSGLKKQTFSVRRRNRGRDGVTLPGGSPGPPSGARPRWRARQQAPGGWVCHGGRLGTAQKKLRGTPLSSHGPTTCGRNCGGQVCSHMVGGEGQGPRWTRTRWQRLALGTFSVGEGANTSIPSDVQKVIVGEEHQQEWSSSLDQDDPEPPHINEDQDELRISRGEEQFQGQEEADITKFFIPMNSEDEEEKPQVSQHHQKQIEQMKTEADGEHSGGSEPARNSDPDTHLHPDINDNTGDYHESKTYGSNGWKKTREPQSGLKSVNNVEVPASDLRCSTGETECGKGFGTSRHLKRQMRSHTGKKPFSCSVCKKAFTVSGSLQTHMRIHTGEKPFICSVCKMAFSVSGHLHRHMRIHTGEKPFNCSFCNKAFIQSDNLQKHMRVHTGEKPFSCSICKKAFTQSGNLQKHMKIHTGEKPFTCSVCKKAFTASGCLHRHMRIHTGEKPFTCSVCKKAFTVSGSLQKHMRIHTGEKPFCCSVCKKAFTESGHLQTHMRIHTGEKPYCCSVCKKAFTESGHLQNHMRIHTGEKPFSCSVCKKAFTESGSLQKHMRIHTGEKPFSCSVCKKAFTERGSLRIHMRIHTGEKRFSCSVCKKAFTDSGTLRKHMRTLTHVRNHLAV